MIKSFCLDSAGNFQEDLTREKIAQVIQDKKSLLWLELDTPTEDEIKILSEVFNFHILAIEDCKGYTDLPKIDEFEDYSFIVIHAVSYDIENDEVKKPELDIFVSKNYVVTVHLEPLKTITVNTDKVRKNPQLLSKGADFLLYNLLNVLVSNYSPLLEYFDDMIEEIEGSVLMSSEIQDIVPTIMDLKRKILALRRSASLQRDVISRLARRDSPIISNKNVVFFRDVYDHMVRIHELLEISRDLLSSTFEIYVSSISNRMNEIMKRLTIVATIFMPLTFISSIYGMNFNTKASHFNMPELNWTYGYLYVVGMMLAIAIGMLGYFKYRKWM
ncbi:MAG: magnesium/cobalt transporter CorA [Candidatus Omnitrophota bacterium]